jgi:hypothetical protein
MLKWRKYPLKLSKRQLNNLTIKIDLEMGKSWLLNEFKLKKYIKSFFKQLDKVLYVLKIIRSM